MPMSGKDMLKLYYQHGWVFVRYGKGSHVIVGKNGQKATIPMHKEIATGTEAKLLKLLKGDST